NYETLYYSRVRARRGNTYSAWSQAASLATGPDRDRSGTDPSTGIPLDFHLEQNYPNPFNPTTQIRYSIPDAAHVTIDILNIQGQHIHRLVNSAQEAGVYSVPFNAAALSSGTYLYVISAGAYRHVKKMTLIK
ncbi:MAG: T9SS C-terminal target domain-containing protein, partial [Balneolaceae bacterium]